MLLWLVSAHWLATSCLSPVWMFFQMYGYWPARCLFVLYTGVKMYGIWRTWKLANSFSNIWIVLHNEIFACYLLVGPVLLCYRCLQRILCIGWHTSFHLGMALCRQLLGTVYFHWHWCMLCFLGVILCVSY